MDEEEPDLLQLLPKYLHQDVDVFSKVASDTLPPHRSYDHSIHLEVENNVGYHPLRRYSIEELKAIR